MVVLTLLKSCAGFLPLVLAVVRHRVVRVPERADIRTQRAMRDRRHQPQPHRGVGRRGPVRQPRDVLGTGAGPALRDEAEPVVGERARDHAVGRVEARVVEEKRHVRTWSGCEQRTRALSAGSARRPPLGI